MLSSPHPELRTLGVAHVDCDAFFASVGKRDRPELVGVGAHPLVPGETADRGDLADPAAPRRAAAQRAVDGLRERFGEGSDRARARPVTPEILNVTSRYSPQAISVV